MSAHVKNTYLILFILCVSAAFFVAATMRVQAADGIHKQINFQGKLQNNNGTNVADDDYSVTFTLYTAGSGGSVLWDETQTVSTTDGIFRVSLGSVDTSLGSVNFNSDSIYLGIQVEADPEMTPRVRFTAVPYAFNAQKVNGLTVTNTSDLPFASTTTLKIGDGKTVSIANGLTFSGTDSTAFVFPSTGGNVVTEAFTQTLTNKTIGSTGLTFSGATTDITTGTDEHLALMPNGTGNVGVGTTSPDRLLSVFFNNTNVNTGLFNLRQDSTGDSFMNFSLGASGASYAVGIDNSDSDKFKIGYNAAGASGVHTGTRFTIDSSGNVGIGTTAPTTKLVLSDGTDGITFDLGTSGSLTLSNTNSVGDISINPEADLNLGTALANNINIGRTDVTSVPVIIRSGVEIARFVNGNVGIGTTSPLGKLNVSGAATGKALTILNETGDQAVFTASVSGSTKVVIDSNGTNFNYAGVRNLYTDVITVNANGGADYTSISSALAAATSGDTVYVYPGTYTGNITIPSGVNLVGADRSGVIIQAPSGSRGPTITLSGTNTLSNLSVVGDNSGWTYTLIAFASSAGGATIDGVNLTMKFNDAVSHYLIDGTNWTTGTFVLRNSTLRGSQGSSGTSDTLYAVYAHTSATTSLIEIVNNYISVSALDGAAKGIYADNPGNSWANGRGIYGNVISVSNTTANAGSLAVDTSGNDLNSIDNVISGSYDDLVRYEEYVIRGKTNASDNTTLQSSAVDKNALVLQAFSAGQTAALLALKNSAGSTTYTSFDEEGNLRVGSAAPDTGKVNITGAYTGKALTILDETGDQDIFTASASGVAQFSLTRTGGIKLGTSEGADGNCLLSGGTGAAAEWGSCGAGGAAWDDITVPTANLSLAMSTYTTAFNYATGTSTNDLFSLTTDASANGTGALLNLQTGASSTVLPLRVRAGSVEALAVDASGNVGIGSTSPLGKLNVSGAATGKALAILDETGDQNIFTASSSGVTRFVISNEGGVGIGTNNFLDSNKLSVVSSYTDTSSGTSTAGSFYISAIPTGTSSQDYYGLSSYIDVATAQIINSSGSLVGGRFDVGFDANATVTNAYGVTASLNKYTNSTLTNWTGVYSAMDENQGALTNWHGFKTEIPESTNYGTITNTYGLYVGNLTDTTQTNAPYAFYSVDSNARSYFAGNVGIGSTSPLGKLNVSGAATGKALAILDETGDQAVLTASVSGSTKFLIDNTGNVGIGTTTAAGLLDVVGSVGAMRLGTGGNILEFTRNSANYMWASGASATFEFSVGGADPFNDNRKMILTSTGRLGLNDFNPDAHLEVSANNSSGDLFFLSLNDDNDGDLFAVKNSGNVGIGSTSPVGLLNVRGARTGQALVQLVETGDQAIFTASAGATTRFVINNNGSVGIGTAVTSDELTVSSAGDSEIGIRSTGNFDSRLRFSTGAGGNDFVIGRDYSDSSKLKISFSGDPGSNPLMTFEALTSGNVGIGTTNPSAFKLQVAGSIGPSTDSTYDIGSTGVRWANGYFDTLYGDGSNLTNLPSSATAWDDITVPTANLSLAMSTFTTAFNYVTGTSTNDLFSLTTDASANGTGALLNIQTGASSTVLPLRVRAGSVEAIYVNSGGNVGIGTTTVNDKLEVAGDLRITSTTPKITFNETDQVPWSYEITGDQWIVKRNGSDRYVVNSSGDTIIKGYFYNNEDTDVRFGATAASSNLSLYANNAARMYLKSDGNVGIGTTAPIGKLHIDGAITGRALVTLNETGDQDILTASASGVTKFSITRNGGLKFGADEGDNGECLVSGGAGITAAWGSCGSGTSQWTTVNTSEIYYNTGNVGIGTTDPTGPLDIRGTAPDINNGTAFNFYPTLSGTNNQNGLKLEATVSVAGAVTKTFTGLAGTISSYEAGTDLDTATLIGLRGYAYIGGAGSYANVQGGNYTVELDAAGTISNAFGLAINDAAKSAGTINQLYGLSVTGQTKGSTHNVTGVLGLASGATNNINLLLGQSSLPTGNWSLYNGSSYNNYFAGNVGIGTTNPQTLLHLASDPASTNTQIEIARILRTTTGTAADNIGAYQSFHIEGDQGTTIEAGQMGFLLRDANLSSKYGGEFSVSTWRDSDGQEGLWEVLSAYVDGGDKYICGNSARENGPDCFSFTIGTANNMNIILDGVNKMSWMSGDGESNRLTLMATDTNDYMYFKTQGSQKIQFDASNDGADMTIDANGNVGIGTTTTSGAQLTVGDAGSAPGVDMQLITSTGGTTTTGVDGLQIDMTQGDDADATDTNAGLTINMTSSSGDADTLYGMNIGNITGGTASETALRIGTGWDNGLIIESGGSTNSGFAYSGAGRPTKTISLQPEYAGGVITAFYGAGTDSSITGALTSDADTSASNNLRTYYEWSSSQGLLNYYTVAVRVKLPKDFSAWATSNALQVDHVTESTNAANNVLDIRVYLESDVTTAVAADTGNVSAVAATWRTETIDDSVLDDGASTEWDAADETAIIYLRMGSLSDNYSRVGEIKLNYLAAF